MILIAHDFDKFLSQIIIASLETYDIPNTYQILQQIERKRVTFN